MRMALGWIVILVAMVASLQAVSMPERHTLAVRAEPAKSDTPPKKYKGKTVFETPEILTTGTLFYVAISVSTLLWCTGKGIDMTLDRQERMAITKAHNHALAC